MSNLYTRNYEIITECDFESVNRLNNTFCESKKTSFKHIKGNTFVSCLLQRPAVSSADGTN